MGLSKSASSTQSGKRRWRRNAQLRSSRLSGYSKITLCVWRKKKLQFPSGTISTSYQQSGTKPVSQHRPEKVRQVLFPRYTKTLLWVVLVAAASISLDKLICVPFRIHFTKERNKENSQFLEPSSKSRNERKSGSPEPTHLVDCAGSRPNN